MTKETIKKLIESSVKEDVILGMALLCKYIRENGHKDLGSSKIDMNLDCWALRYFRPVDNGWNLAINKKKKFCINTAEEYKTSKGFVVYREGAAFKQVYKGYKKEVIYEDE